MVIQIVGVVVHVHRSGVLSVSEIEVRAVYITLHVHAVNIMSLGIIGFS